MRRKELLRALLDTLRNREGRESGAENITRAQRRLRILLAEDNPVNQELIYHLLEKQGHSVEIVSDGGRAVAALASGPFDLVFMDLQMPHVDGFEAVAEIRQREAATGAHVPIIALTAHAMNGDRGRCLAAGMDGYLAKPVHHNELLELVGSYAAKDAVKSSHPYAGGPRAPAPVITQCGEEILDRALALQRAGGNETLLRRLCTTFLNNCPNMLGAIRAAAATGDATALQRAAHSLKGSAGVVCAQAAVSAAVQLERLAKSGDLEGANAAVKKLEAELARLTPALTHVTNNA